MRTPWESEPDEPDDFSRPKTKFSDPKKSKIILLEILIFPIYHVPEKYKKILKKY